MCVSSSKAGHPFSNCCHDLLTQSDFVIVFVFTLLGAEQVLAYFLASFDASLNAANFSRKSPLACLNVWVYFLVYFWG